MRVVKIIGILFMIMSLLFIYCSMVVASNSDENSKYDD